MIPHPKKWFRKFKKAASIAESPASNLKTTVDPPDVAMSELAKSLHKEIQGLTIEIRKLRTEREGLFRDIHDIMLSKSRASLLDGTCPPSTSPPINHKRSTQSFWVPLLSVPPNPENDAPHNVEMGLFGPRSRTNSTTEVPASPDNAGSASSSPVIGQTPTRWRPVRSMSEGTPSMSNLDLPPTPTRTAWRVVERKPESVYLARAAAAAS